MLTRLNYFRFYVRLAFYLLPVIAFIVAGYIRFHLQRVDMQYVDPSVYFVLALLTTITWAVAAEHYGLTSCDEVFGDSRDTRAVVFACLATVLVVLAALFLVRTTAISRLFFVYMAASLMAASVVMRAFFRAVVHRARRQSAIKILIIGSDSIAAHAAQQLQRVPYAACRIVGYVQLPGQDIGVSDAPTMAPAEAGKFAQAVDDVVIAVGPDRLLELPEVVKSLQSVCAPVRIIMNLGDGVAIRERFLGFGGLQMFDVGAAPVESIDYTMLKRAFDLLFSISVFLVTLPLLLLIALAVRLGSSGPVLFSQERVGVNGRTFKMYKFRTMQMAPSEESDTRWVTHNEPRITKVGRLLRRTGLDELPQLINVVKGDMSVVGPRPERPHFVRKFLAEIASYNDRHRLKAGITGWAQVNGWRGDTSIQKRVEYDLYYLQNWSLSFDLRIIVMTCMRRCCWGVSLTRSTAGPKAPRLRHRDAAGNIEPCKAGGGEPSVRIGLLTPEYPINGDTPGGIGSYVFTLARSLAELGHAPHVLLSTLWCKMEPCPSTAWAGGRLPLGWYHWACEAWRLRSPVWPEAWICTSLSRPNGRLDRTSRGTVHPGCGSTSHLLGHRPKDESSCGTNTRAPARRPGTSRTASHRVRRCGDGHLAGDRPTHVRSFWRFGGKTSP